MKEKLNSYLFNNCVFNNAVGIIQHHDRLLVNNESERIWKKAVVTNLRY
jgi:hypothetical protein